MLISEKQVILAKKLQGGIPHIQLNSRLVASSSLLRHRLDGNGCQQGQLLAERDLNKRIQGHHGGAGLANPGVPGVDGLERLKALKRLKVLICDSRCSMRWREAHLAPSIPLAQI